MIKRLQTIVEGSKNIVFFGGAGVSTESGIPDFRSSDGLFNQDFNVPPEVMLSHSYFVKHPEDFFPLLSFKDDMPDRKAKRRALQVGRNGIQRDTYGNHNTKH